MRTLSYIWSAVVVAALVTASVNVEAARRSYLNWDGQLLISHDTGDEGTYFSTPCNEVGYNAQILRTPFNWYYTVFHSEPWRSTPAGCAPGTQFVGDSVKISTHFGYFDFSMPANRTYRVWGSETDSLSKLYYTPVSGGANPMIVAGRHWVGDIYYYIFFLSESNQTPDGQYKLWLHEIRTLDFYNFYMWSEIDGGSWTIFDGAPWSPPAAQRRPAVIYDEAAQPIRSNVTAAGLIGDMAIVGNVYFYFYTDCPPNDWSQYMLYMRTVLDVTDLKGLNKWSAPTVIDSGFPPGTIIRVAKAKGMNRWAFVYPCNRDVIGGTSDICIQYSRERASETDMVANVVNDLREVPLYSNKANSVSDKYLGLASGQLARVHQFYMTDRNGNLASPAQEDQTFERGGVVTWLDWAWPYLPYGLPIYRAGWDVRRQ